MDLITVFWGKDHDLVFFCVWYHLLYILQISNNSPPLEDMPRNVTEDIQKLIQLGWTLEVDNRPYARELLQAINLECHPAGKAEF